MSRNDTEGLRARDRRRWWPIALFLLLLLAFLAWTGWETRTAMRAVDEATAKVNDATGALRKGEIPAAVAHVESAGESTGRASRAADSLPMRVLGSVPWFGRDVRAARITVHSVDGAVNTSVLPLLQSLQQIKDAQDRSAEGTLAVDALLQQAPTLEQASEAAQDAYAPLAGIDPSSLLLLDGQVAEAQERVGQLAAMSAQAESMVKLAPHLLGTDEPRSYLLVFANLSEERPTGGIYGSWALMNVEQGEVSLATTGSNDIFEGVPVLWREQAPTDVQALYREDLNAHQNVNLSPDFPVGAQLVSSVWQRASGRPAPDGVIAVTPVALADALAATGPIEVEGGSQLKSENAVGRLQNEVYTTHPNIEERNDYLARVTGEVFSRVLSSGVASPGLLQHLGAAADSGHIQAWFADPDAQALVADLPLGGVLPADPDPDQVRVYLTNTDASKLGQFTHLDITTSCVNDAPRVGIDFRYEPDPDPPAYVSGLTDRDPPLAHQLSVLLYVPPNRGVQGVQLAGRELPLQAGQEKGWTVTRVDIQLDPHTTSPLSWELTGTPTLPEVLVQPLTNTPTLPDPARVGTDCG